MLAGLIPDLSPVLFAVLAHVAYRDDTDDRILSLRGHGGIEPGRGVDIQARVGRQVEVPDDRGRVGAVIVRQEQRMWGKLPVRPVHSPEEADD